MPADLGCKLLEAIATAGSQCHRKAVIAYASTQDAASASWLRHWWCQQLCCCFVACQGCWQGLLLSAMLRSCRRLGVRLLCCEPLSMLVAAPLHSDDDFQLPWCQPCSAEPQHQSSGRADAAAGRSPKRSADGVGLKLMARQPRGTTARHWHGLPSWRGVLFAEEVQVSRPAWQSSRYLHRELQGTLVADHVRQHCLASCRGKSACCY